MLSTSKSFNSLATGINRIPIFDLVACLTVYSLFRISHLPIDMTMAVISAVLVCNSKVRNSPWFWLAIVVGWLPRMILDWTTYEDHCYFVIYWCGAMGLSRIGNHKTMVLRHSARTMIGLCFALGFLWKLVSPEFVDSSLFHFKLLFDYRFVEMVTDPICGMSTAAVESNLDAYREIRNIENQATTIDLTIPNQVSQIAILMTVWTVFIEGLLAILFLLPNSKFTDRWRDASLILFLLSTYFVVPVMGFATAFTTLGIAQTKSGRMKIAYLFTAIILFCWFSVRWQILSVL